MWQSLIVSFMGGLLNVILLFHGISEVRANTSHGFKYKFVVWSIIVVTSTGTLASVAGIVAALLGE